MSDEQSFWEWLPALVGTVVAVLILLVMVGGVVALIIHALTR